MATSEHNREHAHRVHAAAVADARTISSEIRAWRAARPAVLDYQDLETLLFLRGRESALWSRVYGGSADHSGIPHGDQS